MSARSTSGFKGVKKVSGNRTKKYRAIIYNGGKMLNLGYFFTAEEAAASYDTAAIEIFKDRAVTNKDLGLL